MKYRRELSHCQRQHQRVSIGTTMTTSRPRKMIIQQRLIITQLMSTRLTRSSDPWVCLARHVQTDSMSLSLTQ